MSWSFIIVGHTEFTLDTKTLFYSKQKPPFLKYQTTYSSSYMLSYNGNFTLSGIQFNRSPLRPAPSEHNYARHFSSKIDSRRICSPFPFQLLWIVSTPSRPFPSPWTVCNYVRNDSQLTALRTHTGDGFILRFNFITSPAARTWLLRTHTQTSQSLIWILEPITHGGEHLSWPACQPVSHKPPLFASLSMLPLNGPSKSI